MLGVEKFVLYRQIKNDREQLVLASELFVVVNSDH